MKFASYFLIFLQLQVSCLVWVSYGQDANIISNALAQINVSEEGHSVFSLFKERESNLAAITQLKLAQRYGDSTYDKFNYFSVVRFYGYAGVDMVVRSRQELVAFSIGSYLFPQIIALDAVGRDISDHGKTIIAANTTRFGILFNPFNDDSEKNIYGLLEFDFTGTSQLTAYSAKIRHTFGELLWNSGALLFGQYFHPLFLPEAFPRTVSSSMGSSFEPQALVPQIRLTQMLGNMELIFALASEGYILSFGPLFALDDYIENAIVPNVHFQLKWRYDGSFIGGAIDYKRLVPRLASATNYKVDEFIDSLIGEVFIHTFFRWGEINLKAVYAENGADQLLISGFGVRTVDPITDCQTYANTAAISVWLDTFCVFHCQDMSLGLFVGGVKNLGAKHALYVTPAEPTPIIYTVDDSAQNLAFTTRVSPRFLYARGAFRFGIEFTWDRALFGTIDRYAKVMNAQPVNSFSYEISLDYVF